MLITNANHLQARMLLLKGTSKKTAAHLDFASLAALQYAQAWAANRTERKAPQSLILRRALAVYAAHLETIARAEPTAPGHIGEPFAPQTRNEARALESAGKGRGALHPVSDLVTESEAQDEAMHRLGELLALPAEAPWPSFGEVLYGPDVVARSRAEYLAGEARVAALLGGIARVPKGRLMGLGKALAAEAWQNGPRTP